MMLSRRRRWRCAHATFKKAILSAGDPKKARTSTPGRKDTLPITKKLRREATRKTVLKYLGRQVDAAMLDQVGIKQAQAAHAGQDDMFRLAAVKCLRLPACFQVISGKGQRGCAGRPG